MVTKCNKCELSTRCHNPDIPPEGNLATARILIVGEGPGEDEDNLQRPFIGRSGQVLRRALSEAGIEDTVRPTFIANTPQVKNVVLTNIVNCRPPENATPTKTQIATCFPKTLEIIRNMPNLKLIVPVGNIALRAFTGRMGITGVSGTLQEWEDFKMMPLVHPASILYAQDRRKLDEFRTHVKRISEFSKDTPQTYPPIDCRIIDNIDIWKTFAKELRETEYFVFDTEGTGLNPYRDDQIIKLISFSLPAYLATNVVHILPLLIWNEYTWTIIYNDLKAIFENENIGKVAHNSKYDHLWMRAILGIDVKGIIGDTMLSQYLLHPNTTANLKSMAWGIGYGGYETILSTDVQSASGDELNQYAGYDSIVCHKYFVKHQDELAKNPEMANTFRNLLLPVSYVLGVMEDNGIQVNLPRLNYSYQKASTILTDIEYKLRNNDIIQRFERDTDTTFNPNSHTQLRDILFDERYGNLQPIKTTKKKAQPSTDKSVLQYYGARNPIANLLLQYSDYISVQKFVHEIMEHITPDRKLHTTFWVTTTKSGRSSSTNPNLHNLPKGEKDILHIRKAFVPFQGYVLAELDNSQIELRIMAEEANDNVLYDAVVYGDVHRATAAYVLRKSPDTITNDERRNIGKVMNFQIIYGATEYGVARVMKCSLDVARTYLRNFFLQYSKTKQWMDRIAAHVKQHGYVDIRTGYRRYFPNYNDKSIELTDHEIRSAINTPIQGLAGHILFLQLIGVHHFLTFNQLKSRLALEIHDSIVLNIHRDEMSVIPEIKRVMESCYKKFIDIKIPIVVDIKVGDSLGELQEYQV